MSLSTQDRLLQTAGHSKPHLNRFECGKARQLRRFTAEVNAVRANWLPVARNLI
jgi:hypothetical protein